MKLLCYDEHDKDDICPPHKFEAAWSKDRDGDEPMQGVIFCTACGDVRALTPPAVGAPELESVSSERRSE